MRDSSTINLAEYRARDTGALRALPHNLEAEQQFLGALLIKNDLLAAVSGFLKTEHFCEEIHRRIFAIGSAMIVDGRLASPVTLKTFLGDHDVGGMTVPQYLARLVADAAPPICAADYARAVTDLANRREIIGVARAVIEQATDPPVDMKPTQIASQATGALQAIAETGTDAQTRIDAATVADGLLESARAIRAGEKTNAGVPTGLPDLDMWTGGFRAGELWVLGGRPGQGKTILATGFARKVSEYGAHLVAKGELGIGSLLFSLELPKDQLVARLLSDIAYRPRRSLTFGQIVRGELDDEDLTSLEEARDYLSRLPLVLDVTPGLSVAEIASRVRAEKDRMQKRNIRLAVVLIDYLKFVKATDRYRGLRVYEIGEITGALKQLAKSEDVCIILLVQANRGVEAKDRRDRRPAMADLRDSGDIEADADVVAFIYRESVYIKQTFGFVSGNPDTLVAFNEAEFKGEIIVAKTRSGPTGTTEIWIDAGASRFASQVRGDF